MSKVNSESFRVGQRVVCVDEECAFELDLYERYTVVCLEYDKVFLEGIELSYHKDRFEDFDVWASHQRPISREDQHKMDKIQIKILQDKCNKLLSQNEKFTDILTEFVQIYEGGSAYRDFMQNFNGIYCRAHRVLKETDHE